MQYPNKEQSRALDMLRGIGWNWNHETLVKDTIRCWNVCNYDLRDEEKAYSTKGGRLIATVERDGGVIMGDVTANGVNVAVKP